MVNFGKDKAVRTAKKHRYRYDLPSTADEEIADVLLREKNDAPFKASLLEPDANKAVEDKNTAANESSVTANLSEQIEKLYREYEAINRQLEKSLIVSNDLAKQLETPKKGAAASYLAVCVASLALLAGAGAIGVGVNIQRDVTDLRDSVASLASQTVAVKKQTILKTKEIDDRIALLNDKVDKVFAVDNLDNVLQVTRELRKQVHALANKNFALLNGRNQSANALPKPDKISLPSLELATGDAIQGDKNLSANLPAGKSVPGAKLDAAKKAQDDKLAAVNNSAGHDAAADWVVSFGAFKDKTLAKEVANKVKKAGVPVVVIHAKGKKHLRYQVVSKTLKNEREAQDFAEHIEKTLGIQAVVLPKTK